MQILVSVGTLGASPKIGEILPLCDLFLTVMSLPFSRFCAHIEPLGRFHALLLRRFKNLIYQALVASLGVRTARVTPYRGLVP